MIFNLSIGSNELIQKAFMTGMEELNNFWGINWRTGVPNIYVCSSRSDFDLARGNKTSLDTVAFTRGKDIVLLAYEKIGSDSSLKLSEDQYSALIKHELCHLFTNVVSGGIKLPLWLNEGLSIFLSGQTKDGLGIWKSPSSFSLFIESDKDKKKGAYEEGGFVVELLVSKFGKEKIIDLIKGTGNKDFDLVFKEVYGFSLGYEEINDLLSGSAL